MRLILAALGAMILSPTVCAQAVQVQSGQRVTIMLADGKVSDATATPEPATTAFEEAVVMQIEGPGYEFAGGTNSMAVDHSRTPEPDPIAAGRISFKLVPIAKGKRSLLVIRNGYGQILSYNATMRIGDRSEKTGVCTVGPGLHGFEHWPHPIDSIEISALKMEPGDETSRPRCE